MEKWEDRKKFSFPSCVCGWRDGNVEGWKTPLFGWEEKWEDEKYS